jgi:trimethylamine--corrinoid protein Co-methyltransferase
MSVTRPPIEPIRTFRRVRCLSDHQLDQLQEATLQILEEVGVRFPSEKALAILSDHGARVDHKTQVARFPRDLVHRAMSSVPRYFHLGSRDPSLDLQLQDGLTYFTCDGCGVETVDFETGQRRPSSKADVALMARLRLSLVHGLLLADGQRPGSWQDRAPARDGRLLEQYPQACPE